MSIITARAKLNAIADRLERGTFGRPGVAAEIRAVVNDHMFRESPVRRAPRKLRAMDAATAARIRDYAQRWPDLSQLEIANAFDTNPGRVSEALNYKV